MSETPREAIHDGYDLVAERNSQCSARTEIELRIGYD